ncbi:hypothetical protein [Thermoplasma volcanium GSS1]|uniref:CRISPR system endoribonuclease Csx1 CARF domain-containing protein n=1 Tax=Thermoplasma volcanium (strain ATCC 51530 / DSM 4299 / JCM 9571 / NBRC 15438 / GSS1) TaxID=273116 RepID=Q97CI8_THEVO|nr:CRISPR-associated CARF protein Csx1 [Thermoplasma volcanium]BAB59255.1 hypothetical protein [Thermoplasma volcanium GSS1]
MKSIFISLWGNPERWNVTRYSFNSKTCESITSSRVIYENFKTDYCIIYIPNSIYPGIYKDDTYLSQYQDLINSKLCEFLNSKDTESAEFYKNSNKIIFPSKGSFTADNKNYIFDFDINYIYSYFYRSILNYLESVDKINKIIVDITHGINFLEFIFLESLMYALRVYALSNKIDVNIEYYNSDPYSNFAILNIYKIKSIEIEYKNVLSIISRDFINMYRHNKKDIKDYFKLNFNEDLSDYIKACSIMAQSVTVPYLMYLIINIYKKIYEIGSGGLEVHLNIEDNKIRQTFDNKINVNIETLAFLDTLIKINSSIKYDNGFKIPDIYTFTDNFFSRESYNIFIKNELRKIKSKKEHYDFDIGNFSRNFKAYAGLLDGLYVLKDNSIDFKTFHFQNQKIDLNWIVKNI